MPNMSLLFLLLLLLLLNISASSSSLLAFAVLRRARPQQRVELRQFCRGFHSPVQRLVCLHQHENRLLTDCKTKPRPSPPSRCSQLIARICPHANNDLIFMMCVLKHHQQIVSACKQGDEQHLRQSVNGAEVPQQPHKDCRRKALVRSILQRYGREAHWSPSKAAADNSELQSKEAIHSGRLRHYYLPAHVEEAPKDGDSSDLNKSQTHNSHHHRHHEKRHDFKSFVLFGASMGVIGGLVGIVVVLKLIWNRLGSKRRPFVHVHRAPEDTTYHAIPDMAPSPHAPQHVYPSAPSPQAHSTPDYRRLV